MQVVIRADSSLEIATGHIMRCLALANGLRKRNHSVTFVCRALTGNIIQWIRQSGFVVHELPSSKAKDDRRYEPTSHRSLLGTDLQTDIRATRQTLNEAKLEPDVLVVDHYALDEAWEREFRSVAKKIMVIDDFVDRRHDCDLLLDQNYYHEVRNPHEKSVSSSCKMLLGPNYALLRPEFAEARQKAVVRTGSEKSILVFLGGVDKSNLTKKVLNALNQIVDKNWEADVVVGSTNPSKDEISEIAAKNPNFHFHIGSTSMAELMAKAAIGIGGAGSSTWERCSVGLPSILFVLAENQALIAQHAKKGGFAIVINDINIIVEDLALIIDDLFRSPEKIKSMSQRAFEITDGLGVQRVCDKIENLIQR
jgi:UDP-2,4-diacetamido-2,4,6-trideoxy-beta-L-altropyranose hydrolase